MYLSRIELDEKRRDTMHALASPNVIHGVVESSIAGGRSRNLWRIDRLYGRYYLLILSQQRPNLRHISSQFGSKEDDGEIKDYNTLFPRIKEGQRWQFRLCANPIHREAPQKQGERGKVYAHVTIEQQKAWLMSKASGNGFVVEDDEFDVVESRWDRFDKYGGQKNHVVIRTATFEGILTITDAELFCEALRNGIGRAKAYGCGLLTVMKV